MFKLDKQKHISFEIQSNVNRLIIIQIKLYFEKQILLEHF